MIGSKSTFFIAVIAALGGLGLCAAPVFAAETVPEDQSAIEQQGSPPAEEGQTEAEPSHAPLRLRTVDYQDQGSDSGKLTLAGIALPGKEIYLFLDDQPLAKVDPDNEGNWKIEKDMKLGDGRHALRADQYDTDTNMLAARAMVSIERAKQDGGDTGEQAPKEP
jgi:hypothetical protein